MDANSTALKSFTVLLFVLSLVKAFVDRSSPTVLSDLVIVFIMIAVTTEQMLKSPARAAYLRSVKLVSFTIAVALLVASGWMGR